MHRLNRRKQSAFAAIFQPLRLAYVRLSSQLLLSRGVGGVTFGGWQQISEHWQLRVNRKPSCDWSQNAPFSEISILSNRLRPGIMQPWTSLKYMECLASPRHMKFVLCNAKFAAKSKPSRPIHLQQPASPCQSKTKSYHTCTARWHP